MAQIDKDMVLEENEVKPLGIKTNSKLKFDSHISNVCSKANKNLGYSLRARLHETRSELKPV